MEDNQNHKVTKLEGSENWTLWKFQIKVIFRAAGLWELVSGITPMPQQVGTEQSNWLKLDAQAQKTLVMAIEEEAMLHILNCNTAADMWAKLESVYEQKSRTSIHFLQQAFFQYNKDPNDSMAVHISKIQKLVKQLADLGEDISENMLITKILMTLPDEYNHFFSSWEATSKEERNLKNLTSRLCMEEARIGTHVVKSGAFYANKQKQMKEKSEPKSNKNNKKPNLKCFICKRFGHWKRDCPDKSNHNKRPEGDAFISEVMFLEETMLQHSFFVDSGASDHMSNNREWFTDYIEFATPKSIRVGNGEIIPALGKGNISIKVFNGSSWNSSYLADVLYVPNIKLNLFSSNSCLDKGYEMFASGNECLFKRNGKTLLKGIRHDSKLFRLLLKVDMTSNQANIAVKVMNLQIWHERMCHQAKEHVKKVLQKNNINYKKDDVFCDGCALGKQHRLAFDTSYNRAKEVGELVHTDLCGPMQEKSYGGARYMLLFRDDFSNYRVVYCLKEKTEVSLMLKRFLALVEAETKKTVKVIRSDNGLEYINKEVAEILLTKKVVHQKTVPYTPEQNGRAERDMRTVIEAARSLIHTKELSLKFWGEAVKNVVYTLNRTGKSHSSDKSPYELWFGKVPDIMNLHIFGTKTFVHIPQEKRQKLDPKSKRGIFVGYEENCKGFRIWIPSEKRIEISRNVIFREDEKFVTLNTYKGPEETTDKLQVEPEQEKPLTSIETSQEVEEHTENSSKNDENPEVLIEHGYFTRSKSNNPSKLNEIHCAYLADVAEPQTFKEAIEDEYAEQWKQAMNEEYQALIKNDTWKLTHIPKGKHAISSKWVYKLKRNHTGEIDRFKARLVIRGFMQKYGIDYTETFSPVAKFTSIRTILALSASDNFIVKQFDIKTAFLYGDLDEEIYMHQPEGYADNSGRVCMLKRSLYGLKQASRCWNKKFTKMLKDFNLKVSSSDPCVFYGEVCGGKLMLAIYIDDGIVAVESKQAYEMFIKHIKDNFEIKLLDSLFFLGIEIVKGSNEICMQQALYCERILNRFRMMDAKAVTTPAEGDTSVIDSGETEFPYREAVGSLMYLALATRPDICYAVCYASRFLDTYKREHVVAVKRIFKYLRGTISQGIKFTKTADLILHCFTDSDFAGDKLSRHSTGGYIIMLSNGPISWSSKKQSVVALSTTEAEYIAACECVKEIIWVQRLKEELMQQADVPNLYIDNQSTIKLIKNPEFHQRTKHIQVKYHFIREVFERGGFNIKYVNTKEQLADILTKPLKAHVFNTIKPIIVIC